MPELPVRPGFNLNGNFRGHASAIRFVCCNAQGTCFYSCDDKTLRAWRPSTSSSATCEVLHELVFPSYQAAFVTAMMSTPEPLNSLFVACLDSQLRIYSEKLRLRSCMPWANGQVRQIVYNGKRDQIITAGSSGVKSWYCELDYEACRSDVAMDLHSIPRTKDGEIVPWGFGKYQHARLHTSFHVPGARSIIPRTFQKADGNKDSSPSSQSANISSADWCERIVLHEGSQTLFAVFMGSIYGYDAGTGAMTMNFANLHPNQIITSMVYAPANDTMFTATLDQAITVWRISGNVPQKFRQLGKLIHHMVGDDPDQPRSLLTSSYDGMVTLWSADSLEPVHRMRLAQVPHGLLRVGPDRAVVHLQTEVKVFTIQHLYDLLLECNSVPQVLHRVNTGLILAEFADCSVRLLDVGSDRMDKSAAVTVPQLSTNNLLCSACSLTRRRLYALLSDGSLHVWQLHPNPGAAPTFLSAWTHLQREQCISMDLLEAGSLAIPRSLPLTEYGTVAKGAFIPPNADPLEQRVSAVILNLVLGLDNNSGCVSEHLVLGSRLGDILVVDADRGGSIVCRFPGFKHQGGVTRLALSCSGPGLRRPWQRHLLGQKSSVAGQKANDVGQQISDEDPILTLVVVSRNYMKVWDLELGLRFMHAAETSHLITCLEVSGSRAFLGTATGSVHILDLYTGRPLAASSSLDHMDCVTALSPSLELQHVVTAGRDCHIKVYDFGKALKRSMYVGCPVNAVAFLNVAGDILMAIGKRLVIIESHKYAYILHESGGDHLQRKESIFADIPKSQGNVQHGPSPRWQDFFIPFVPPPCQEFLPHRPSSGSSQHPRSARTRPNSSHQAQEQHSSKRSSITNGAEPTEDDRPLEWQDDPLWFIRSKDRKSAAEQALAAKQRAVREQKRKALQEIARSQPYLQPALIPHQTLSLQSNIRTASRVSSTNPSPRVRITEGPSGNLEDAPSSHRVRITEGPSGNPEDAPPSHRVRITGCLSGIPEGEQLSQQQLHQPQLSAVQRVQRHQQQQEQEGQQRAHQQSDGVQQRQQQQGEAGSAGPQVPDTRKPTPPSGIPRVSLKVESSLEEPRPTGTLFASLPNGATGSGKAKMGMNAASGDAGQKATSLPLGLPKAPRPSNAGTRGTAGKGLAGGQIPMFSGSGAAAPGVGAQGEGYHASAMGHQGLLHMRSMVRFSKASQQRRMAGTLAVAQDAPAPKLNYRSRSGRISKEVSSSLLAPGSVGESEGGVGEGSSSGSETESESDSDEGDTEKAALKALRQQQLAFLAQHWRHNELVKHQTYFHVDLMAEELKQRKASQLAPDDPYGPVNTSVSPSTSPHQSLSLPAAVQIEEAVTTMRPSSLFTAPVDYPGSRPQAKVAGARALSGFGGDSMESGTLTAAQGATSAANRASILADADTHTGTNKQSPDGTLKASTQNGGGARPLSPNISILSGLKGGGASGSGKLAVNKEDIKGLAAEFRRALPLLCSQTAFMEGLQTAEEEELIAALRGEFDDAGTKKRRRRKGRRRGRRRKGEKGATHPLTESTLPPSYTDSVFGGWNKVPSMDNTNTALGSGKGGPPTEKRKGGKRSKRGGKGGKASSLKALRAVDMAAYLSKVTRDGFVASELLQFDRHSMLTHTGKHAYTQSKEAPPSGRGGLLQPLPRLPSIAQKLPSTQDSGKVSQPAQFSCISCYSFKAGMVGLSFLGTGTSSRQ
eukprot:CAMPEP_0202421704 /NCGR_PEP_ID=MMETSP1128-20130828/50477_1 /ASSEMBLY_ACC=CAM_ASM_000463 /TAXON_ID=3047 /ORGANISM="Dunaliella tertiolecta, Strain CCMP1320" /LENGTH=1700 /DNA_ID=CAMNT_0049029737 /DNA_START=44 /DNA_END=5146 /DNA_ORIENTATION=-